MRKHHISDNPGNVMNINYHGVRYIIPLNVAEKYRANKTNHKHEDNLSIEEAFSDLINKYGEAGSLLRGLRAREGLTQVEFAKKINITQANLSAMETGKRPIGKDIAMRISKKFKMDYRLFL